MARVYWPIGWRKSSALLLMAVGLGLVGWGSMAAAQSPTSERSGGQATIYDASERAFEMPVPNLDTLNLELFSAGERFFHFYWITTPVNVTYTDGLAPLFNSRSCEACHVHNGRGQPPQAGDDLPGGMVARLSIPGQNERGEPLPEPTYGHQLQDQLPDHEGLLVVTYTEQSGTYADGTPYSLRVPTYTIEQPGYGTFHPDMQLSPRLSTPLIGLGLLEAVPDAALLALADPDDLNGDGISGRVNYVWDEVNDSQAIGRFGWKASQPNLVQQVALALSEDMGITTPIFPQENCTAAQPLCPENAVTEMTLNGLLEVVVYIGTLAVPAQRDHDQPQVQQGQALFNELGCAGCHVPALTTGTHTSQPLLSNQLIHPYTDLLLHDMGAALADDRPDFEATGQEWRTPPLWGIGLTETINGNAFYLHDGRARSLEEAILWHGGEAQASRDQFAALSAAERRVLLAFLKSL